jgi:hypothetical protein
LSSLQELRIKENLKEEIYVFMHENGGKIDLKDEESF